VASTRAWPLFDVVEQATFMGPWTQLPSPDFEREFVQYHWAQRAQWTPARWSLQLGIYPAGERAPAGIMGVDAEEFGRSGSATTGSWLRPRDDFALAGLDARRALFGLPQPDAP
jgi:hypothetical protein